MSPTAVSHPPESAPTVDQLIARFQNGDREAFGGIWSSVEKLVHAFFCTKGLDHHHSQDLCQCVAIRLMEHLSHEKPRNLRSYTLAIARNIRIDDYRHHIHDPIVRASEFKEDARTGREMKQDETLLGMRLEVADLLRSLPEDDRNLLYEHFFEGRTPNEIAANRKCSNSYISRLLRQLRDTLAERFNWFDC